MDPSDTDLADLALAQKSTFRLLDGLDATVWERSTPCSEWDVADVVRHLVVGERAFAVALGGEAYDLPGIQAEVGDIEPADLAAAYEATGRRLRDALTTAGPGPFPTGLGPMPAAVVARLRTVEALVHGWDVARGAGVVLEVEEPVVVRALDHSRAMMARLPPGRTPFGPEQPVPDDAAALDRLTGLLGRS